MKKIDFRFALPNLITLLGLCLGLNALKLAIQGNFEKSLIFLVLASIIDALDGRIARMLKSTSKFGAELDSLTDFVNFGVCPGVILYFWSLQSQPVIGWTASLFFIVSCCLRLARFNISSELPSKESWRSNFFTGVPSPAGAGIALMPMILSFSEFQFVFDKFIFSCFFLITSSFLMISKIPTYAFKNIKLSKSTFVILALLFVIIFTTLFYKTFEALASIILVYFLTIPISFFHFLKLKKNKGKKNLNSDSLISDEII
jgi:CDP-diacylglycerol--serine O-phosphatidyltransferase